MSISHREKCANSCPICGIVAYTRMEVDGLLIANRTELREQIAQEIEADTYDLELPKDYIATRTQEVVRERAANIARGEVK